MKFTPKTLSDKISCTLAEFSIELGSPVQTKDKSYAAKYNKILGKYHKKIMRLSQGG